MKHLCLRFFNISLICEDTFGNHKRFLKSILLDSSKRFLKQDHLLGIGHFCKNFGHRPKLYLIPVPTDCPRRQIQVIWCIVPGFMSRGLRWHSIKYLITFHNLIDVERFLLERWNKMIVFNFDIIAWYRNI